jgi:aminobenzoyl-glutamate utilization protein B
MRMNAYAGGTAAVLLFAALASVLPASASDVSASDVSAKAGVMAAIEASRPTYAAIAHEIWEWAEVGYQEEKSSARLQAQLRTAGFEIESNVAGMPTAFIASYGSGFPTIALLAEFDALPGLSQAAVPDREPVAEGAAGHGCGHHLFGAGSVAAAAALRDWMERSDVKGTLRVYGTPAEEGGSGKVYLTRAGLFDDVDIALHWHPADKNRTFASATLANKSAEFHFVGEPAHAARSPERGRSALDGVEAMDFMVNLMREHMPEKARIHYVITGGGDAPNIVPERAAVYYYVRHPEAEVLQKLWHRVEAAAEGAARGTGTRVDHEVMHGNFSLLPNDVLTRQIDTNLRELGGVVYDEREKAFATQLRATIREPDLALGSEREVQPLTDELAMGSTDVGDVSWNVPTGGVRTATWVPGTAAHSWQAVAAGGMSIGNKGMMLAAKVLAATAIDLFLEPELVTAAHQELEERRGPDFRYAPLLGDRAPPLDYRRR